MENEFEVCYIHFLIADKVADCLTRRYARYFKVLHLATKPGIRGATLCKIVTLADDKNPVSRYLLAKMKEFATGVSYGLLEVR